MTQVFNINQGWLFSENTPDDLSVPVADALQINLPHTWNAGESGSKSFTRGRCVYQKQLPVPAELMDIRIFLEFKGVGSICDAYIDGKHVGRHVGAGTVFRFEITSAVTFGKTNIISVVADNTDNELEYSLPVASVPFGGIYRDVNMIIAGSTHFALDDYGSNAVYLNAKVIDGVGKVAVTAKVSNPVNYDIVSFTVYDSLGNTVGSAAAHPKQADAVISIDNPQLWRGREDPYLYTMKAKLLRDGVILDEREVHFGFRKIELTEDGLELNGENIRLKGVVRYADRSGFGSALTSEQDYVDIKLIKELGANAVRLAGGQHSDNFINLCDNDGIVVITDIPMLIAPDMFDKTFENAKTQLLEIIRQNYNHPSVLFWGLGEPADGKQLAGDHFKKLNELVKSIDKSRLTFCCSTVGNKAECADLCAFRLGAAERFAGDADAFYARLSQQSAEGAAIAVGEYGVRGDTRYHSVAPVIGDCSEEYQAMYHEKIWDMLASDDGVCAGFAGAVTDYSSFSDVSGNDNICRGGLVSYDREVKKDAFYFYKSQWSTRKFVHITSPRFINRTEKKITIKVYSNCRNVSLILNGREGRPYTQTGNSGVFVFSDVKLVRGHNTVLAVTDEGCRDEAVIIRKKNPDMSYIVPGNDGE